MRVALAAACLAFALTGCLDGIVGGDDAPGPRDYVSSRDYRKWVIEYDVVEGQDPPGVALSLLVQRLTEVVSKPEGVELRKGDTLPRRGGTWTQDDVLKTSSHEHDLKTGGDTVTIHLLIVDGTYEDGNVLGATYFSKTKGGRVVSSGPIVLFAERIHDTACPLGIGCLASTEDRIWQAVLVHEFGHAMGLVNTGAPMQSDHEDDAHPGHSDNSQSVMYYAVETIDVVNVFQGGPPTTFDADDKADLCALGGKCQSSVTSGTLD